MALLRFAVMFAAALIVQATFSTAVHAQSITLSSVNITDISTNPIIHGTVSVSGLPDGTYNYSVINTNQSAGGQSKNTSGTFTVTNGMATLNIIGAFPVVYGGDVGTLELAVWDPNDTDISDSSDVDWRVPGGE